MIPDFMKYVVETTRKLNDPGLLLVGTDKKGKSNVMTIGWGLVGILWGLPVFMVAVRPSRFTHRLIEAGGEFTVNVPKNTMDEVVAYCGKVSGKKHDKFKECKLTLVKAKKVKVPVIMQCKIHYECKVVHKFEVVPDLVPSRLKKSYYSHGNYHTVYFGKIVAVY